MKSLYIIFILFLCGCLFHSCDIETSDNGKLDGFWYAESIDSLSGAKATVYHDCYWSFQFNIMSIRRSETLEEYLFHFNTLGDSLFISEPYKAIVQGTDSLLPDNKELLPLGIQSLEEGFQIIELSDHRMKLQSKLLRLNFRKL